MQFTLDHATDWKTPDYPEAIGFCLAEAAHRLAGGPVAVAVRDPFTQVATVVATSSGTDKRLLGEQVTSDSAAGRAMLGRITARGSGAEELLGCTRSDRRHLETTGLAFPIRNEGQGIGALTVFAPHHTAEGSVTDVLAALADDAGPLIGRVIAQRVVFEKGLIDSVTGYPNREGLERALHQHVWTHCSLLRTDIDRFDEMGEGHGTVVMKHLAHVVRRNLRDDDVAARIDRGRFALFLPDTPLGTAITVAERVHAAVLATAFQVNGEQPVSCSFAVAAMPETVETIDDLLAAATKASVAAGTGGDKHVVVISAP
jgi:diguanylate cyclase (GGDEF)-like protein